MATSNGTGAPAPVSAAASAQQPPARIPQASDAQLAVAGIEVEHLTGSERWNGGHCYTGAKEALIAAGIADDGAFPGDPGRGWQSCSYDDDGTPSARGRASRAAVRIERRGGAGFVVHIYPSDTERALATVRAADAKRWREERKLMQEADIQASYFESIPALRGEVAVKVADALWEHIWEFWNKGTDALPVDRLGAGGLRALFSEDDRKKILSKVRKLYWAVHDMTPTFDRDGAVLKERTKAAKLDRPLQVMLGELKEQVTRERATLEEQQPAQRPSSKASKVGGRHV